MIIAAAEQMMTDLINESGDDADALAQLTTGDVCADARGYARRDGSEGPIPKATMWKHFKTIQALATAVVDNMTAANHPAPEQILALAAGGERPQGPIETPDSRRLEARFSSKHYDVEQLEAQFDGAETGRNRSDMLYWAAELAERHLSNHRRGDHASVAGARGWSRRGLTLVDIDSRLDCMLGIRCARAAAAAETILSRKPDYEPTALNRIRSIKETELSFAETLGWDVHSLMAQFHIDHARALGEEDPQREMRSIHAVATALPELCSPDAIQALEPQDRLEATELADVIAALCRIELAYVDHIDHANQFRDLFGRSVTGVAHDLIACFQASLGERQRHEGNVRALLRLVDFARRLDESAHSTVIVDLVEDYHQASADLLRTAEFDTIRDLLVANYLTAKAQSLTPGDEDASSTAPERTELSDRSIVNPKPITLIHAAIQFFDHAAAVASRRGSAGVLRDRAARSSAELTRSNPVADFPGTGGAGVSDDAEFDQIAKAINDLVLITISRKSRFTDTEIQELIEIIDPMYYYITSGRK
ncbi:hypothetical protein [Nocardia salmonicida]|uniref:hypothetical protein n=1 Tax=Nocardia salmonicida TaxID=53431 RepID=UPI0037BD10C8